MFSRRVATFLLGVWIGCCLLADAFALQSGSIVEHIVGSPIADARDLIAKTGAPNATLLLQYLAGEHARGLLNNWEVAQLTIALAMIVLLVFTDQRKLAAIALCAIMAVLTVIQHFFVMPDWILFGRQADLLPEAAAFSTRSEVWKLTQTYGAMEIVKLLLGGVLASYFFVMEATKRTRRKENRREEDPLGAIVR